jgi:hypothetical protein
MGNTGLCVIASFQSEGGLGISLRQLISHMSLLLELQYTLNKL